MRQPGATPRGPDGSEREESPDRARLRLRRGDALSGLRIFGGPDWSRGGAPGSRIPPLRGSTQSSVLFNLEDGRHAPDHQPYDEADLLRAGGRDDLRGPHG